MTALKGKVAIVTGAAQGIGRAIAERFVKEGARTVFLDRNAGAVTQVAEAAGGIPIAADVTDETAVGQAVERVISDWGGIGILVNNAAADGIRGPVTGMSLADWTVALNVNLTGAFLLSRAVLPQMIAAGSGTIINVASQLGSVAVPGNPVYCASKGGLLQLTRAMALDHGAQGIRVNALSPGAVLTDRLINAYGSEEAVRAALTPKYPLGRIGMPDDLAGAAVFLASDDARFMTGADLVVDGGYSAQ